MGLDGLDPRSQADPSVFDPSQNSEDLSDLPNEMDYAKKPALVLVKAVGVNALLEYLSLGAAVTVRPASILTPSAVHGPLTAGGAKNLV